MILPTFGVQVMGLSKLWFGMAYRGYGLLTKSPRASKYVP